MISQASVSVIVPVFNAECCISECLDSLVQQTYPHFELILVDDGSTDSSASLCEMYAAKDCRIRVFHIAHQGSAAARQFGFEQSVGKYIACVDADDWVDTNFLESMVTTALKDDADMVISAFWQNNSAAHQIYHPNCPSSMDIKVCQKDALFHKYHAGLWNKLLKRDILMCGDILVPPCDFYEDMVITMSYLQHSKTVSHSPEATYHYMYNAYSLTNDGDITKRVTMLQQMLTNMQLIYKAIIAESNESGLLDAFFSCVNHQKLRIVDEYPDQFDLYKNLLLEHVHDSYSAYRVKGISTFCHYCALRGVIFPQRILNSIRSTVQRLF